MPNFQYTFTFKITSNLSISKWDFSISNDKIIDMKNVEIHCKGVAIKVVQEKFKSYKKLTLARINQAFDYGKKYIMLSAMNVPGGKCLLPVEKFLARDELRPNYFLNYGYGGTFENER